jgi:hypothetical protein
MPVRPTHTPVSRSLIRIIRESSRLKNEGASIGEHLAEVDSRQTKSVEFYLRACAMRLDQDS